MHVQNQESELSCICVLASTIFLVDFGNVPTVWYLLFFQILEMFRQCGIFCFSRFWKCSDSVVFFCFSRFWKCSDSVVFFVFLDFGNVRTVWYIFAFLDFGNVPTVWYFLFFILFFTKPLRYITEISLNVALNISQIRDIGQIQEHLSSPPVFSGVRVTSLVFCVMLCRS